MPAMADTGNEPGGERPGGKKRRKKRDAKGKKRPGKRRNAKETREEAEFRANMIWAIAHPLRRRILRVLANRERPRSPMQMSREFGVPVSAVAYHVTILRNLDAVELADEQMARGAVEHFYETTIEDDPPIEALLEETRPVDEEDE
jgi:DNA-binding transcriptional ArsR family regulator